MYLCIYAHAYISQCWAADLVLYVWPQIKSEIIRDSKFGSSLVISTHEGAGGGYLLGFRIDPKERAVSTLKEIADLRAKVGGLDKWLCVLASVC